MRRFALTCTLLTGLVSGLLVAASPADAAAASRVKFVITSLTGQSITVIRDIELCNSNRRNRPGRCTFDEARVRTRYQRTIRVRRSHLALVDFVSYEAPFRMRVYVNGVKMEDYRSRPVRQDDSYVHVAGIIFLGPGAINRL